MPLTMIAIAVLWVIRSNEIVYLIWPDADFLFTMIAMVLLLPHLLMNLRSSAKAFFLTSGSISLRSARYLLLVIYASAIMSQNPTRSLPYIGLATVFIMFWITMVEVRWRDGVQLKKDLYLIYIILSSLVFLSVLVNTLEFPLARLGTRFRGVSSNPNFLGLLALLTLSLTPAMFCIVKARRGKLAIFASTLLALDALFASESRGSMLALIIGYSIYIFIRLGFRKLIIPTCMALAIPLIVFPNFFQAAISIFIRRDTDDEVSAGRFEIYGLVFDLISDSWLWLHGAGFRAAEDLIDGVAVHNIYLQVLLELGFFGLIAFLVFVVGVLISCFRGNLVSVFIIPVLSILAFDLTESSLFGFGNYLTQISWLLMGFALAVGRLQNAHTTGFFATRLRLVR